MAVYNNQQYLHEQAMYTLRARWVEAGGLLCAWDCHGHGKCIMILDNPTCVCNDGMLEPRLMVTDAASVLLTYGLHWECYQRNVYRCREAALHAMHTTGHVSATCLDCIHPIT